MINWELIAAQAVGLTIIIGSVWAIVRAIRQSKSASQSDGPKTGSTGPLEDRVRVLERIATDDESTHRTNTLAHEIEKLRFDAPTKENG